MKIYPNMILFAATFIQIGCGTSNQAAPPPSSGVLHIQQTQTVTQSSVFGWPTFLAMYQVLNGATSPAQALSLTGTLSLTNNDAPYFSEVLLLLVYFQGTCPANDPTQAAGIIWADILKNPTQSTSNVPVNLTFPKPLPMTGCIGLYYMGGPLIRTSSVTMSADLNLTYQAANSNLNTIIGLGGEYCFGQTYGCQNATADNTQGFGVPTPILTAGHLAQLYGNFSDSTFDGTSDNGPLPTGSSWGAINDFYLLPGGCGNFGTNLNSQGFANPVALTTLYSWIPQNAVKLASIPVTYNIPPGASSAAVLQPQVQTTFSTPPPVNAGDCIVEIFGRTGNGATDNETQVNMLMTP